MPSIHLIYLQMKYVLVFFTVVFISNTVSAQTPERPEQHFVSSDWLGLGVGFDIGLFGSPTFQAGMYYTHTLSKHQSFGARLMEVATFTSLGYPDPMNSAYVDWTRLNVVELAALYGYGWQTGDSYFHLSSGIAAIAHKYTNTLLAKTRPDISRTKFGVGLPLHAEYMMHISQHTGVDLIGYGDINNVRTLAGLSANLIWIF
jgi:hypothetical protein